MIYFVNTSYTLFAILQSTLESAMRAWFDRYLLRNKNTLQNPSKKSYQYGNEDDSLVRLTGDTFGFRVKAIYKSGW